MNTLYEHPPRPLSFYLRYIAYMLLIGVPYVVILPIWYPEASLPIMAGFVAVAIVLRWTSVAKPLLNTMTILQDVGVPKEHNISKLNMSPPDEIASVTMQLDLEGFERLGEAENYAAGADKPVPSWAYQKSGGKIIAEAFYLEGNHWVGFVTYGTKGLVITTYPQGHQLNLPNARFGGVKSTVEDAYRYHVAQVLDIKGGIGKVVPVKSLDHHHKLDRRYASLNRKWMGLNVRDFMVIQFLISIAIAPGIALFATWWIPSYLETNVWDGWRLVAAPILLIGGLLIAFIVEQGKSGIGNVDKAIKRKNKGRKTKPKRSQTA